jgi:hypothetical protein
MNFEDDVRHRLHRAGEVMPEARVDWTETIGRARRSRRIYQLAVGLAAAVVVIVGALTFDALSSREPIRPVVPAPTPSPRQCSAEGESFRPLADGPRLPRGVADMRMRIIEAAQACDYEALEDLALRGSRIFTFSYGAGRNDLPAEHWRSVENGPGPERRHDVLRTLVRLLGGAYTTRQQRATPRGPKMTAYIWPAISAKARPTEADWKALQAAEAHTPREIARMKRSYEEYGITYLDYRLAILENGDWVYFVAGD